MKKRVLPIALLLALGLVACGPTAPSSEEKPSEPDVPATSEPAPSEDQTTTEAKPSVSKIEITNKAELQAEWHALGESRTIAVKTDVPINIAAAIKDGDIVFSTDNDAVIKLSGKVAYPLAEGKAKITVTYKQTITDFVEVEVLKSLAEPAMKPQTIAGFVAQEDKTGLNSYFHNAEVTGFKDNGKEADKYGNLFVKDATQAESVLVYGSTATPSALEYDLTKSAYKFTNPKDFLTNPVTSEIAIGDKLDLVSIRSDYGDKFELMSIIRGVNGVITPSEIQTTDEVFAAEFQNKYAIQVTGTIVSLDGAENNGSEYGNVTIKTAEANKELTVYGLTANTDCLKIDAEKGNLYMKNPKNFLTNETTKALKVGDTITMVGIRADYEGKPQIKGYLLPKGLVVDKDYADVKVGTTYQINASLKNAEGTITYTSDHPEFATVSETGLVEAKAVGKAVITVACGELTKKVTINAYVPAVEPAYVAKTLAEVVALEQVGAPKQAYTTKVKVKEFTNKGAVVAAATEYGNMNVTDEAGTNEIVVYGASATETALVWNEVKGEYYYKNAKDFTTNSLTKDIKIGDILDCVAIRKDFTKDGTTTKQINIVITKVNGEGGSTEPDTPTTPTGTPVKFDFKVKPEGAVKEQAIETLTNGDVTLTAENGGKNDKGYERTPFRWWDSDARAYDGNIFHWAAANGKKITGVVFECSKIANRASGQGVDCEGATVTTDTTAKTITIIMTAAAASVDMTTGKLSINAITVYVA